MLRCSRCKATLPESAFSPRRYSQTTHFNAALQEVTYRNRCSRGRHYWCNACRRARWRETRIGPGVGKVSARPATPDCYRAAVVADSSLVSVEVKARGRQ